MSHSITHTRIREAAEQLALARPLDADRLTAARNVLLRGGWRKAPDGAVQFSDGAIVSEGRCSCQEGRFIVCLHQLAADILAALAAARAVETDRVAERAPTPQMATIGHIGGATFRRWTATAIAAAPPSWQGAGILPLRAT